ncbi:Phthiocerol synthesis polyketide synthase type I PpsC [Paraburkholderia nemoris]|nr:Phthiocerol synthesis polyketide synthase type I PpsC [Paraburkholderia nemoris]
MSGSMKATWYEKTGPATDVLVVGEMVRPEPEPGEVLVRVRASGVNPSDVKARAGTRAGGSGMPFPRIVPHSDGAGVIEACGAGVDRSRIGQRVWLWNGQWQRAFGTCAEYVALPANQAVPLPKGFDDATGASLGIPALTAAHLVCSDGPVSGQTVLISGGAGTVGMLAVQLARWGGAHVVATARPGADTERVLAAGAHHVVDYANEGLEARVLEANNGRSVDRIVEVEFGLNIDADAGIIKPRGRIATFGSALCPRPELPFYPLMFKGVRLEFVLIYLLDDEERAQAISHVNQALESGALKVPVHARFVLADVAQAHQAVERGRRTGTVIVEIS